MIKSEIPSDETAKHSYLFQFSKLFVRLLRAITPNGAFVYSDEARDLYLSYKEDVLFFANAIEDDNEEFSVLGIRYFAEDELPEDLSTDLAHKQVLEKFLFDIEQMETCVDTLQDSIGQFLVALSPSLHEQITKDLSRIEDMERQNGVRTRLLYGEMESGIQKITLESIQNDLTFRYVKDKEVKTLLNEFLGEVLKTFKAKAFRSCVVAQRAILEAILVDALQQHYDDAMIEFVQLYRHSKAGRITNGRPPLMDWWQLMELVDVAKKLGILTTPGLRESCYQFNAYRNTIHIHNRANQDLQTDDSTCLLGFYCLRVVNDNISKNLEEGHENGHV